MKKLKELKKINFEKQRDNLKNIIQVGFINDSVDIIYFTYLKETNLFNLDSYTSIELSLTYFGLKPSIGQLIKLPNINIFNNSIHNELEISAGVVLSVISPLVLILKANVYNYLKLFNELNIVLKSHISIFSEVFDEISNSSVTYQISPGLKINLFNKINAFAFITTFGSVLEGLPQFKISLNLKKN